MLYIEHYEVLLLHLNLSTGYLGGFHFLDCLHRPKRFKYLIVIGISGMSAENIHSNSSLEKLDAFLLKPVTRDILIKTIQDCVASHEQTTTKEIRNSEETAAE